MGRRRSRNLARILRFRADLSRRRSNLYAGHCMPCIFCNYPSLRGKPRRRSSVKPGSDLTLIAWYCYRTSRCDKRISVADRGKRGKGGEGDRTSGLYAPLHAGNRLPTTVAAQCGKMYTPKAECRFEKLSSDGRNLGKREKVLWRWYSSLFFDNNIFCSFTNLSFILQICSPRINFSLKVNCLLYCCLYSKNNPWITFLIPRSMKSFSVESKQLSTENVQTKTRCLRFSFREWVGDVCPVWSIVLFLTFSLKATFDNKTTMNTEQRMAFSSIDSIARVSLFPKVQ